MATVTIAPARPRRLLEMMLMLLALALGIGGYALTALNRTGAVPENLGQHVLILVVVAVVAEVGMHFLAPYADPVILPIAVALTGIGLAMIYRIDLSYLTLNASISDPTHQYPVVGTKQLMMVGVALVAAAALLIWVRDHKVLRRFTYLFGLASLVLLVLPLIPGVGVEHLGARIWIQLGPVSLQPAELVKITLAIFFSGYLVTNRDNLAIGGPKVLGMRLPRARDLGPILVVWLIGIAVLVLQRDLGTSLLFFGLFVALLYVATDRVSWLVIGALMFLPAAALAVQTFPHVQKRFTVWLHAMDPAVYDAVGGSGQVVQGLFGQASGGLMGTGWGRGYPHLVPFAQSDFILSSLAEELGLTGLLAILTLYLILIERGLRASIGVRDGFGKLLAAGLSFSLALQVFVVLGGITRVIPLTGLTAPFLASGGSSMVSSWLTVAILVRISDAARRPVSSPAPWTTGLQAAITDPATSSTDTPTTPARRRPSSDDARTVVSSGWDRGWDTEDGDGTGDEGGPRSAASGHDTGSEHDGNAGNISDTGYDRNAGNARNARNAGNDTGLEIITGDLPEDTDYPADPHLSASPEHEEGRS